MIFHLDSTQIVIDGAQSWYGEVVVVGPGICGGCAAFVGMGFGGAVLTGAQDGYSLDLGASGSVVFSGGQECGVVPVDAFGGEYV